MFCDIIVTEFSISVEVWWRSWWKWRASRRSQQQRSRPQLWTIRKTRWVHQHLQGSQLRVSLSCFSFISKLQSLGRFRKHNATPNRDVTCLGIAWARLPVNREVASAWPSQREEFFSDVLSATPCFWGPSTPFSLQYRLRQHVRLSPPRSMMTYHVAFDVALCFLNLPFIYIHVLYYVIWSRKLAVKVHQCLSMFVGRGYKIQRASWSKKAQEKMAAVSIQGTRSYV